MTTPQVPLEIPVEVCATVGVPWSKPRDECMNQVRIDVGDDGVSAPKNVDIAGLQQVVADAKQQGIDLKVVVVPVPQSPRTDAPLRDIAIEVGHAYPGSTVLVTSPIAAGTYSTTYDRVVLEAGQDAANHPKNAGNPVQATKDFVTQLQTPEFPWTMLTIVLVVLVAIATVLTRVLQVRSRRAAQPSEPAGAPAEPEASPKLGAPPAC